MKISILKPFVLVRLMVIYSHSVLTSLFCLLTPHSLGTDVVAGYLIHAANASTDRH